MSKTNKANRPRALPINGLVAAYFRFTSPSDGGKPSGWVGMAFSKNGQEGLYHAIDEHGDPTDCEVLIPDYGSVCISHPTMFDDNENAVDEKLKVEFSETAFDKGWFKPVWSFSMPSLPSP